MKLVPPIAGVCVNVGGVSRLTVIHDLPHASHGAAHCRPLEYIAFLVAPSGAVATASAIADWVVVLGILLLLLTAAAALSILPVLLATATTATTTTMMAFPLSKIAQCLIVSFPGILAAAAAACV